MKQNFLVAAAFVLTFAAGVLTGGLLVRQLAGPPPMFEREMRRPPISRRGMFDVDRMQKHLDLSEAQRREVEAIVEKYRDQIQEHIERVEPPMRELMRGLRAEVEQVLTPEQREKFQRSASPFWRKSPQRRERFDPDSMSGQPLPEAGEPMP
ncbi:hypothetical protein HUU40_06650 [candidate division KSB1 bacterium]|nr:hypothetical protein [candidate division KSB1 bacterium]